MKTIIELFHEFCKGIEKKISCDFGNALTDYIYSIDNEDLEDYSFEKLTDYLYELNFFNVDVIYYNRAIEFLKNNDPSLRLSIELASEMGYTVRDISSEVLASLLASDIITSEFYKLENEFNDFFNELKNKSNE